MLVARNGLHRWNRRVEWIQMVYGSIGLDAITPEKVSTTAEKVPTPSEKVPTPSEKVPTPSEKVPIMPENVPLLD